MLKNFFEEFFGMGERGGGGDGKQGMRAIAKRGHIKTAFPPLNTKVREDSGRMFNTEGTGVSFHRGKGVCRLAAGVPGAADELSGCCASLNKKPLNVVNAQSPGAGIKTAFPPLNTKVREDSGGMFNTDGTGVSFHRGKGVCRLAAGEPGAADELSGCCASLKRH